MVFAILFVLSTVLAIWSTSMERLLFSPQPYKNALSQEHVYYQLPGLLSELLTDDTPLSGCAGNPVTCEAISSELKACYLQALGEARYGELAGSRDLANPEEQAKIQDCYSQYPQPGQMQLQGKTQGPLGTPAFMKSLAAVNWEAIINLMLPPQDLQSMLEGGLDQAFAYLNGQTDQAGLSLVKIREHLAGPAGTQIPLIILHSQPACTTEELEKIVVGLGNGEILICNPLDDQTLGFVLPMLQQPLNSLVMKIPDQLVIIAPPPAGAPAPGSGTFGRDPISTLRTVRRVMEFSPAAPVVFLLLVTVFGVRSTKSWLQCWGIPALLGGVLTLGLAAISKPAASWGWNTFIVTRFPPYLPSAIPELGAGLVRDVIGSLLNPIVVQAVFLSVLGLLLWAGSFFVKSRF